ncbi:hypothetical protein BC941DRAFT_407480 [Chlamydoabsidia padenii]|nr:hypothetical protein BC941DRAFT_407480 [Chlamydoabsidia padenii]
MMQPNVSTRQTLGKKTLGEVSTNTTNTSKTDMDYRHINPDYWVKTFRKRFSHFRMFLDNFDEKTTISLQRKIKLLNGDNEVFFGAHCTHIVTSKPFYEEPSTKGVANVLLPKDANQENQENRPIQSIANSTDLKTTLPKKSYVAKDPSHQAFFDRANQLGMEVWSLSKMLCISHALLHKPISGTPANNRGGRAEDLDKLLMEEKRYGVSTGQRNGQAPRPTFVAFNDHYIKVEDVTGVHRPILVKEYTQPTFDPATPENYRIYPWPKLYVRVDEYGRSPFTLPESTQQLSRKNTRTMGATTQQQQQQIPLQQQPTITITPDVSNTKSLNKAMYNTTNLEYNQQHHPSNTQTNIIKEEEDRQIPDQVHTPSASIDTITSSSASQLTSRTSVFTSTNYSQQYRSTNTPFTNSTTLNTSDKSSMAFQPSGQPLSESMSRLGRRIVTNQRIPHHQTNKINSGIIDSSTKKADGGGVKGLRSAVLAKATYDQAERRKKDLARRTAKENTKYCENCNVCYDELEKHQQEESHQAFVRDKNNFKALDMLLETTRRTHR